MPYITIDGKEYDLVSLSDEPKDQLAPLQFVDSELALLQAKAAALQTARMAYSRALQAAIQSLAAATRSSSDE